MGIKLETLRPLLSFDGLDDYGVIEPFIVYGWPEITIEELMYIFAPQPFNRWTATGYIGDAWVDKTSTATAIPPSSSNIFTEWKTRAPDGNEVLYRYYWAEGGNRWTHLIRRFTTSREFSVWVDATKKYSATVPSDQKTVLEWNPDNATYPVRYRRFVLGANVVFSDKMMCKYNLLRIYNRALNYWEIRWNYENPDAPITNGLVLWLKMDEGSGNTVYDSSGYNNHGTIYGATWGFGGPFTKKYQLIYKPKVVA